MQKKKQIILQFYKTSDIRMVQSVYTAYYTAREVQKYRVINVKCCELLIYAYC